MPAQGDNWSISCRLKIKQKPASGRSLHASVFKANPRFAQWVCASWFQVR